MNDMELLEHTIKSLDLAKKVLDDTVASAGKFALRRPRYGTEAEVKRYDATFAQISDMVKKSKIAYIKLFMASNNVSKPRGFEIVYSENDNKHYLCMKES